MAGYYDESCHDVRKEIVMLVPAITGINHMQRRFDLDDLASTGRKP
jgi:hypothetical protein